MNFLKILPQATEPSTQTPATLTNESTQIHVSSPDDIEQVGLSVVHVGWHPRNPTSSFGPQSKIF